MLRSIWPRRVCRGKDKGGSALDARVRFLGECWESARSFSRGGCVFSCIGRVRLLFEGCVCALPFAQKPSEDAVFLFFFSRQTFRGRRLRRQSEARQAVRAHIRRDLVVVLSGRRASVRRSSPTSRSCSPAAAAELAGAHGAARGAGAAGGAGGGDGGARGWWSWWGWI